MGRIFMRGLWAIIPIALTVLIFSVVLPGCEKILGTPLRHFIGEEYYVPGMGLVLGLILIFLLGALLNTWMFRWLYRKLDQLFASIPLIKVVYNAVGDLVKFFKNKPDQKQNSAVMVDLGFLRCLGFITREDLKATPLKADLPGTVSVFVPFSYQIGGLTLLVPKDKITPLEVSFEEAMRFIVTGGMAVPADASALIDKV